jgi:hypothetical protein
MTNFVIFFTCVTNSLLVVLYSSETSALGEESQLQVKAFRPLGSGAVLSGK